MTKKKRIVLIDGDIIVFRTACACEERSINVLHKKSERSKIFKNRTEFKSYLTTKDFEYIADDYEITDQQELNENLNYKFLLDAQLKSIQENLWADETLIFIAGKGNFRESLPLPKRYKGQRDNLMKPLLRDECKSYLMRKHKAELVHGEEVDDRVIWVGYEYLEKGYDVVIVTSDKDANAYSGLKLYNYTQDNPKIVEIPRLGSLWLNDKGDVKGLGMLWYAVQHLIADSTDGMSVKDLTGVTFGEKSAYKLLKDVLTSTEVIETIISKYKEWIGEGVVEYIDHLSNVRVINWLGAADLYFKGIRMIERKGVLPDFRDFAKIHGIWIEDELINYVKEKPID